MLYHKDEYPVKRGLTESEVAFLNDLQKEMNTQDHLATADPRFWVIMDFKRHTGEHMESYDGYILQGNLGNGKQYIAEGTTIEDCMKTAIETLKDTSDLAFDNATIPEDVMHDKDAFCDFLETAGVKQTHFVEFIETAVTSQVFLSQRDAEDYLKKFHYHFTNHAYVYCDCGIYNDELKQLINILHTADFTRLLEKEEK